MLVGEDDKLQRNLLLSAIIIFSLIVPHAHGNEKLVIKKLLHRAAIQLIAATNICLWDYIGEQACASMFTPEGQKKRKLLKAVNNLVCSTPCGSAAPFNFIVKSGKEEPAYFNLAGGHKIASTQLNGLGTPIYINIDLFFKKSYLGSYEPLGMAEMSSLIFHELGHQLGYTDHLYLDQLAEEITQKLPQERRLYHEIVIAKKHVYLDEYTTWNGSHRSSSLVLNLTNALVDLSPYINEKLQAIQFCKEISLKKPFWHTKNLHWVDNEVTSQGTHISLKGFLQVGCLWKLYDNVSTLVDGKFQFQFLLKPTPNDPAQFVLSDINLRIDHRIDYKDE